MAGFFRKAFQFFLFSSLFIAICAVLMVYQTEHLLQLHFDRQAYMLFVFFATISSYNFHWYLTPHAQSEKIREQWTATHRHYNLFFVGIGLVGGIYYFFYFIGHWWALLIASGLTFLYSAPKINHPLFASLRKIAVGKTLFLAFVWMYVTTVLPLLISGKSWTLTDFLYCSGQFFLIYAICIPFDYRDREDDRMQGIKSMITYFDEKAIDRLFYLSVLLFSLCCLLLYPQGFPPQVIACLLLPGIILLAIYRTTKRNFSDYLYYFVLDGLMMFSALFTSFLSI